MDIRTFKETVITFLDDPSSLQIDRETILVSLGSDLIEATLSIKTGAVWVTENEKERQAEEWIVQRLARLPLLADRILATLSDETACFIDPTGSFLDHLYLSDEEEDERNVTSCVECTQEALEKQIPGVCSMLYLVSDAGEGKTTLINHLARLQAQRYKNKETDWLLLPVALGGRPFLRFDEVIVGAIVNRFRFQSLYFDSFIKLVQMGLIVPALDGFEEMFVEGRGDDAISGLGNLLALFGEEGAKLLIAARKAYFDYKSLYTQSRLWDSLPNTQISFARLAINRWSEKEFISYCGLRGVTQPEVVYSLLIQRLPKEHAILTRAVLAKRLVDLLLESTGDQQALLEELTPQTDQFFVKFVETIIDREANEKWIDKSGDPPKPLLSPKQHHELLGIVAQEMWVNKTANLSIEVLDVLSDLFCQAYNLSVQVSRQVMERLRQHALLTKKATLGNQLGFDHEEFYHFFLGYVLGDALIRESSSDVRLIARIAPLPTQSVIAAVGKAIREGSHPQALTGFLSSVADSEGPASFTRANCGLMVLEVLAESKLEGMHLKKFSFDASAMAGKDLCAITFSDCFFQLIDLNACSLRNCRFERCEIARIEFNGHIENVTFDIETRIHSVSNSKLGDTAIFDPATIRAIVRKNGINWEQEKEISIQETIQEPDERMETVQKAIRPFLRSTQVNEGVFSIRLGQGAKRFFDDILPDLLTAQIMQEVPYRGGGQQRRFRLCIAMGVLTKCLEDARGSYDAFIRAAKRSKEG